MITEVSEVFDYTKMPEEGREIRILELHERDREPRPRYPVKVAGHIKWVYVRTEDGRKFWVTRWAYADAPAQPRPAREVRALEDALELARLERDEARDLLAHAREDQIRLLQSESKAVATMARTQEHADSARAALDAVAKALHPHWVGDGHTYLPDQLAGMVERLQERARSLRDARDQADREADAHEDQAKEFQAQVVNLGLEVKALQDQLRAADEQARHDAEDLAARDKALAHNRELLGAITALAKGAT